MNFSLKTTGRCGTRGFTLIELMVALAIIGILVAVAFPAYQQSVLKSRRSDAKAALLDLAAREERYLSTANVYTDTASLLGYAGGMTVTAANPMNIYSGSAVYYTLSVIVTAPSASTTPPTPAGFTATATAQGPQASDTCGNFKLDNTGLQSVSGTATAANCW